MKKQFILQFIFVTFLAIVAQKIYAQKSIVTGVEHVGISVPNMETALPFFTDILGFTPVTEIGPFQIDEPWRKKYRIHSGADLKKIIMLRAGNGANIELFQYTSDKSNKNPPYADDMGWSHIAFYTENIEASVSYLESKGVKVLNPPIQSKTGPTAGETWVYFLSPWGTQFELVSYPKGKAYESSKPSIKLWTPTSSKAENSVTNKNLNMETTEIKKLINKHLATWGEKDQAVRINAIKEIYADNVTIIDPFFELHGTGELDAFISELQAKHPGYIFSLAKPIDSHTNIARVFWQFGPASKPDSITGQDVFVIENNKIQSLLIFIDAMK